MLENILNIEGVSILNKEKQSKIIGGGDCKIFLKNSDGQGFWSARSYSLEAARFHFDNGKGTTWSNGYRTTGFCCATCGGGGSDDGGNGGTTTPQGAIWNV